MTIQKALFNTINSQTSFIPSVPISQIKISPFNPRKTWDEKHVERLAQLIERNGYDNTFAIKCHRDGDAYQCFAGSNRLKACQLLQRETIPVFLYDGCTDEEIWNMAYQDNEQADAQQQFSIVDIWLDYKEKAAQGWTQQKIADVLGVSRPIVGFRIGLANLPDGVLNKIANSQVINERCALELPSLLTVSIFDHETLLCEIIDSVLSKTAQPTSTQFKKEVERYNAAIEAAKRWADQLEGKFRDEFLSVISDQRTAAVIENKGRILLQKQEEEKNAEYQRKRAELDKLERDRYEADQELRRQQKIQEATDRLVNGDSREQIHQMPDGVKLLFTDPPYGKDFQSNRRVKTAKADKIANDGDIDAAAELSLSVLRGAFPKMQQDSAVLVWCDWKYEPHFRQAVEDAGFEVKNSIVWEKPNHGTGDLVGSFAPKHERLLFAVKGRPIISNRLPDVLRGGEFIDTDHPTPKPLDLIDRLIDALTMEGDMIADPFMGCGSTGVSAIRSGRKFWGCEIERHWWEEANANISKLLR